MEPLWGEFAPIAEDQVHVLLDGELIKVAGRRMLAAFTPGHAHHHVAYVDLADRIAFTGDVGGVRMQGPITFAHRPHRRISIRSSGGRASIGCRGSISTGFT